MKNRYPFMGLPATATAIPMELSVLAIPSDARPGEGVETWIIKFGIHHLSKADDVKSEIIHKLNRKLGNRGKADYQLIWQSLKVRESGFNKWIKTIENQQRD